MSDLSENMILDFTETPVVSTWEAIDDRIMGGCSQSRPEYVDKVGLRFSGTVSLENNGGFASIRSNSSIYNLGKYSGLKLRLRGDGKTYKLSLRTDLFFDGVSYQAAFTTQQDVWQEISLPFEDFTATHHGIKLTTVAPLDTSKVESFGLFIADKQEGPFQLEIAWAKGA
ncbi:MAG: CIA30 family protein [Deltaproteobacteria bacterium]|nr:MAG: CIA30 family protein [Deltaproteobacteria bacterium]